MRGRPQWTVHSGRLLFLWWILIPDCMSIYLRGLWGRGSCSIYPAKEIQALYRPDRELALPSLRIWLLDWQIDWSARSIHHPQPRSRGTHLLTHCTKINIRTKSHLHPSKCTTHPLMGWMKSKTAFPGLPHLTDLRTQNEPHFYNLSRDFTRQYDWIYICPPSQILIPLGWRKIFESR